MAGLCLAHEKKINGGSQSLAAIHQQKKKGTTTIYEEL